MKRRPLVLVSGGFDPLHVGHLRYLEAAAKLGRLVVVAMPDRWLVRKKGYAFQNEQDRVEILRALRCVDEVVLAEGLVDHIAGEILRIRPAVFAKGGDRSFDTLPAEEVNACRVAGTKIVCGVGGDKVRASSELVREAARASSSVAA